MGALGTEFSDAPRRTTDGQKMHCAPTTWTSLNTIAKRLPACKGCTHEEAHGVTEYLARQLGIFGFQRYSLIPANNRPEIVRLHRVQTKMFFYGRTFFGLNGDAILYNAGQAADNSSQFYSFEIVAGGPGFLDLKGRHPGLLGLTASRVNPAWPFADPVTGTYGRLVFMPGATSMPAGAVVEYLGPSVLVDKSIPIISKIIVPETFADINNVTFRVEIGNDDGTNARQPWDARFPPFQNRYFCKVRWQALAREDWKDFQGPREMQVSARKLVVEAPTIVNLTNSAGGNARVLLDTIQVVAQPPFTVDVASRITSTGPPYQTTLDLTDLALDAAIIRYVAEAVDEDTARVPTIGQCRWSKRDPSGSWIHDGAEHCAKATSATGFANGLYHQACWLPGRCNQFQAVDESPDTVGDANWWASLWTRTGWVLFQGVPGISSYRNFWLVWREGVSIGGLVGSWTDQVFRGKFETREEWAVRPLGKRVVYTDSEGQNHGLLHGATWLSGYSFIDGPSYQANANSSARAEGIISEAVDGWTTGKDAYNRYPWRYTGGTQVYEYTTGGGSMRNVNTFVDSEAYVAAINSGTSGAALASRLRQIYGGS